MERRDKLKIQVITDSPMQDIFAVKCCSFKLLDQNLEVIVTNTGDTPVRVRSHFDVIGPWGTNRIENLIPQGDPVIEPDCSTSFYCYLDEVRQSEMKAIVMHDADGMTYREALDDSQTGP